MYICINCGKEVTSFACDCERNTKLWDSGERKNRSKTKLSKEKK